MTRTRSPSERRAMFANIGKDHHAMNRDMAVRAVNTLPDTPENRKEWEKDSRRIDIEGIDTPIDMKTVLIIQSANPYPEDLKIGSREEFYDETFLYDPKRGRHPASGSGRLPTKHVPFYEVVDVGGKNKWKVVNPYTGEIKYYPYGEHSAAKVYYDGLYDYYLKSKGAPSAPTPKNEIFVRGPKGREQNAGVARNRGFNTIPEKEGYNVGYKPWGKDGAGYYYIKNDVSNTPNETVKQKYERESNYLTRDQVDDMPYRKLNQSRLDPTIDYLPNETDAEIQHVMTVKDKPSQHGVVYHDKYIMLAEHSAKKREIKPIPSKH